MSILERKIILQNVGIVIIHWLYGTRREAKKEVVKEKEEGSSIRIPVKVPRNPLKDLAIYKVMTSVDIDFDIFPVIVCSYKHFYFCSFFDFFYKIIRLSLILLIRINIICFSHQVIPVHFFFQFTKTDLNQKSDEQERYEINIK